MNKTEDFVKREIVVHAPLEDVWDALTKPEHLNCWYTKEAEIDFRVGGRGFMNHGWGAKSEGIFTEIDSMKRFVLQSIEEDFTTITSLSEVEDGIKVSIEYHSSFLGEMSLYTKENMLFGTGQFLENLKSVYETGEDIRPKLWNTWIGITHTTNEGAGGTRVLQVNKGSVAAAAGIETEDVILEVDKEKIAGYESFERALNKKAVNQTVALSIERKSKRLQVNCRIDPYPVPY